MKFSTFLSRPVAMANPTYRRCDRAADSGPYCISCGTDIMDRALSPFYGGRRKKPQRPQPTRPSAPPAQQRLFG